MIGVLALSVAAVAFACAPRTADPPADADVPPTFGAMPTFPEDAAPPVRARFVLGGCVGGPESSCHGLGAGGMVLPDGTPSNLINVPSQEEPSLMRVKPGDPANSYLYRKTIGAPTIDGGRMPPEQTPLDERSIRAIVDWIEAGAAPL